ncbi:hypothetical protein [Kribbella solani]|uniref:DUF8175 domain-containing protein n=1 Tax=Kribbella solani TaxID=236067 RepID=A0A841DSF0_9ACTN|nr:hypothetical protein [Kribbella solani]
MSLFRKDPDSGRGDHDAGENGSFWQQRGFIAAVIVVGAVVVCGVVWVLAGRTGQPGAQPSTSPSVVVPSGQPTREPSVPPATPTELPSSSNSSRPTPPPPPNNSTGGCNNPKPDQAIPRLLAPPAVSWTFEGDILIPLQAAGGPATTSSTGVRSCFAHSPTGAVLAAMVMLGQVSNQQIGIEVLETRTMPGPGRAKAIAGLKQEMATPQAQVNVQFAGFKVLDYTPGRALIQIAAELENKGIGALPITMVWSHGDWRVQLQEDGSFNGQVSPDILSGLNGYVRFSGAS